MKGNVPHPLSVHINNMQLSQEENVKNLTLQLDRRLTWHKNIFAKWKKLRITHTKKYWLLGRKSQETNFSYNQSGLGIQLWDMASTYN
jgi:hypothetical protein